MRRRSLMNSKVEGSVIYYTSTDGNIVTPKNSTFRDSIVSNTYESGKGMMIFNTDITSIGNGSFLSTSLTSIIIPDSVTSIGDSAFACCTSLTSVTIPDSITEIGYEAFCRCTSLTNITIGNGVISIGDKAFQKCTSLTTIVIPNSVTSIGSRAFWDCTLLTSVYCKPTTPPILVDAAFYNNASGYKFYVPTASVDAYKTAQYWSRYASYIVGYDFEVSDTVTFTINGTSYTVTSSDGSAPTWQDAKDSGVVYSDTGNSVVYPVDGLAARIVDSKGSGVGFEDVIIDGEAYTATPSSSAEPAQI